MPAINAAIIPRGIILKYFFGDISSGGSDLGASNRVKHTGIIEKQANAEITQNAINSVLYSIFRSN